MPTTTVTPKDRSAVNASSLAVLSARPGPAPKRHANRPGHGAHLSAAFEALESFPALIGSRDQLLKVAGGDHFSPGDMVAAIEADVALTITVLRAANRIPGRAPGRVESVVKAVSLITPEALRALGARMPTFDFFDQASVWLPEQFRAHALATRHAAEQIANEIDYAHTDRLMVTTLLHDIGKLVLIHAYPDYPERTHAGARTPEERLRAERRELGLDHAVVGGVLARRWGMPKSVASAIERHHADDLAGEGPCVRLADMLAHQAQGAAVARGELVRVAGVVGIDPKRLRTIMCDSPHNQTERRRGVDACPLTASEVAIMSLLAEGKIYKQIGQELDRSPSTVRSHLHNAYRKLGVYDRAQAVMLATKNGWLRSGTDVAPR
jgi:putative nucleotidyltransferase with HDIG domain